MRDRSMTDHDAHRRAATIIIIIILPIFPLSSKVINIEASSHCTTLRTDVDIFIDKSFSACARAY